MDFLGEFGSFVGEAGVSFAFAFFGVEAAAVEFAVTFHVFVLRHGDGLVVCCYRCNMETGVVCLIVREKV